MEFTSARRDLLQKAFAKAHKNAENPKHTTLARAQFYDIAKLIWDAHGETGDIPPNAGEILAAKMGDR